MLVQYCLADGTIDDWMWRTVERKLVTTSSALNGKVCAAVAIRWPLNRRLWHLPLIHTPLVPASPHSHAPGHCLLSRPLRRIPALPLTPSHSQRPTQDALNGRGFAEGGAGAGGAGSNGYGGAVSGAGGGSQGSQGRASGSGDIRSMLGGRKEAPAQHDADEAGRSVAKRLRADVISLDDED